ncbi:MAG: hypothetical protein ACMUIE_00120 [Thermoplasmatota archaeon]
MAIDTWWIASELMMVAALVIFLVAMFMIPSKDKVRSREAGTGPSRAVPYLIIGTFFFLVLMGIFAFLMVKDYWVVLVTDAILIVSAGMVSIDYYTTRRLFRSMGHEIHHNVEVAHGHVHPQHNHHHGHIYPHQAGTMTVECPQCGGHITIPEGSHQITCPYCGISGTI